MTIDNSDKGQSSRAHDREQFEKRHKGVMNDLGGRRPNLSHVFCFVSTLRSSSTHALISSRTRR